MSRFREIPTEVSFPALEHAVLARWQREATFQRSIDQRAGGPEYVFYDGPPFATGLPHYGHILTSYIKDVVPRYFAMRGHHVPRRWGWDCHGLPVELEIEKELGCASRADILAYGIGPFNRACEASVLRYADEWRRIIGRLGRWVDFDHDYKTMDQSYMESVVWVFRSLHDQGLIYEGDKVVAFCTRCQTTLSNFEARLDDAFRPRQDPAITVRFRIAGGEAVLAWTTTPWTLPSNVALAVGPDIEYVRYDRGDDRIWLAEPRAAAYARELDGYQVAAQKLGRDLVGTPYEPLFPYFAGTPNAFRILAGAFVTTEDGTGVVHLAPAFGEDDHALCTAHGIAGPNPVQDDGTFDATVTDFAGQHVFAANPDVARMLAERGAVFRRETCDHNYPHCWRCDQPLIYRAIRTWFLRVTAIKQRMLDANQQIRWIPEHVRDGRFGNWLDNARDWAVSRNRFWGAPIPVWRCDACGALDVVGSKAELERKCGHPVADWHRPAIDEPAWPCSCGGTLRRVPDVLDCWFESGAMPYAQVHYPFGDKAAFEATFPGDFIVEYIAQTRGWFYTLVVLSAALFDKPPFQNAVCHGVILAADGRKMSKRLKNYPDPMEIVEQHGSDALRIALLSSAAVRGTDLRFSADAVRDAVRRFCIPVWNSLHYFCAYARIDDFRPTGAFPAPTRLDRHLLHETETLRATVDECMTRYDFAGCYDAIEAYIVLLSTWYIRLSKQRLWRAGTDPEGAPEEPRARSPGTDPEGAPEEPRARSPRTNDDKRTCYEVLFAALATLARVIAPFAPFLAETVHGALGHDRSVHLEDWPAAQPGWLAPEIAAEMATVRRVVRLARSIREQHDLRHRHPLRSVAISGLAPAAIASNLELLAEELNVKQVRALDEAEAHTVARRVPKLDYGKLGKRLRGEVKVVQAAIDRGDYELAGDALIAAGHRIEPGEFQLRYLATEGLGVAAEEGVVVVLDLTSDPKLVEEGRVRDLNRGLQDLRKQANLAYERRVRVSVVGSPELQRIVDEHRGWLADQVLATEIVSQPLGEPLASARIEVGDEQVAIAVG